MVLWLGCAMLHTIYDLKVRPLIQEKMGDWHEDGL